MKKKLSWIILLIVLLVAGGYYFYWKNANKQFKPIPPKDVKSSGEIKTSTYTNSDHKLTLNYPDGWKTADLGGDKNITAPLMRENIVFIYDPANLKDKKDVTSAQVSTKVLRFVVEKDKKINSEDDWYSYIKQKVDDYAATLGKENNYTLLSLHATAFAWWAIEERYYEPAEIQGRDLYIYNQKKNEFYQIVNKAPKDLYDKFLPYFDLTINSFTIEK